MNKLFIAASLMGVLASHLAFAQIAPSGPTAPPALKPMTAAEQIARWSADAKEFNRQLVRCQQELTGSEENAAADREGIEEKLNDAIAHSQALDKQIADLKAKYEPTPPPSPTPTPAK